MKKMKIARGTARSLRRAAGGGSMMKAPSPSAQAAIEADRQLANRKLSVAMFHKSGAGVS